MSNLIIDNVTVFDGDSPDLLEGPVVIEDGVVTAVGERGQAGWPVLDGGGGTVVPGMIDAHFHAYGHSLSLLELEASRLSYTALAGAQRLSRALRRGFTTVRDVAGGDGGLARAIAAGLMESPRYLFTGPALSQTGGHGDGRPPHWDSCALGGHTTEVVDGVDALRVATRDRFRQGAHAIKLLTSGGVVSPSDPLRIPQYSGSEIAAVCEEARRVGSYVAAHAYSPEAIIHSVTNGVRSIEHGNLLDGATATTMAELGVFLVPTLVTYDAMARRGGDLGMPIVSRGKNQEVLDHARASLEIALAAGVQLAFGTDLMGPLEDEQLDGLRLQAEVIGILETLRSATSRGAQLLMEPDLGRLRPGARGDAVVLNGNPFEQPDMLWSGPRYVVQGGKVVGGG